MRAGHEPGTGLLFIGRVDHSSAFAECLEETGYTPPVPQND
jgi:hypothetical protein